MLSILVYVLFCQLPFQCTITLVQLVTLANLAVVLFCYIKSPVINSWLHAYTWSIVYSMCEIYSERDI